MEAIYYGQMQLIIKQRLENEKKNKTVNRSSRASPVLVSSVSRTSISSNSSGEEERKPLISKNRVTTYNSIFEEPRTSADADLNLI